MSRIADSIKEFLASKESEQLSDKKKTAVSMRLDDYTVWCVDKLVLKTGVSRTALCQNLISDGVLDALEAIGLSAEELRMEYSEENFKSFEKKKQEEANV